MEKKDAGVASSVMGGAVKKRKKDWALVRGPVRILGRVQGTEPVR